MDKRNIASLHNRLVELINKEGIDKISYRRIAVELNISFSLANQIAKVLAELFPDVWKYERGYLIYVGDKKWKI